MKNLVINRIGKQNVNYLLTKMSKDTLMRGNAKVWTPLSRITSMIRFPIRNNLN